MALDVIATKTSTTAGTSTTDFTIELPSAYSVGDKLFIAVYIGGTGAVTTPSGWTSEVSIVSSTFTRFVVFSKTAVANEPDPVVTTASAYTSAGIALVVTGQDATTYLDVAIETNNHGGATGTTLTFPAITPTSNNTLIIDVGGTANATNFDCSQGKQRAFINTDRHVTALWYGNRTAGTVASTSENFITAGRPLSARIAIRGASGNGCPAIQESGISEVVRCTATDPLPTPADITARRASFNGVSTTALTSVTLTSNTNTIVVGTTNAVVTFTPTETANLYIGFYSTFATAKDMSGLVTFNYTFNLLTTIADTTTTGMYFEDSSGNWALKQIVFRTSTSTPTPYWVTLSTLTSIDSSGAINWADIKYLGFAYRKLGTGTASRVFALSGVAKNAPLTITGDCNPRNFTRYATSTLMRNRGTSTGALQETQFGDVQIGNGTNETHYIGTGASVEGAYDTPYYFAQNDDLNLTVYASASDTIDFSGQVLNSTVRSRFTIHASSSTSATYYFSGLILRGYTPTLKSGITFRSISFIKCDTIDAKGATLIGCSIDECVDTTTAMTCVAGASITDCAFTKNIETYALTLETAGSYDLTDNTYTGYTNAIHVTATTGTVTITTDNPSLTYVSDGATVVLLSGVNITIDANVSLVGAEIRIYDLDNAPAGSLGTELAGVESCPTATYVYNGAPSNLVWIQVMQSGYEEFGTEYTIPSTDATLPITLITDNNT